ncbi:unnamed protein product, partial [Allacma fusca]
MESKTAIIVYFLFVVISVAADVTVKQTSVGDDFLRNINEKRRSPSLTLPHFKETRSREKCSVVLDDLSISFEDGREISEESLSSGDFDAPLNTVNIAFSRFGEGYLRQNSTPRALILNGNDISDINFFLRDKYPINLTELQHDTFTPFSEVSYPKKFNLRSDPETFGEILRLEGKNLGDNSSGCNVAPATDGSVFSGNVTKETILSFYSEDLCSVVPLSFNEVTTYKGIPASKFVLADDALQIAACDCKSSGKYTDDIKTCLPVGAVDVKTYLPYVVSLPHFLNADPKYTKNVSGMSANDSLHLSHFIIEPVTGSVLESSLKFQLNVNLLKFEYENLLWYDVAIQDTVFPLFWTEKKFSLAEKKVVEIRRYLEELTGTTTTVEITQETTSTGISDNTSTGTPTGTTSQDKTSPTVTQVPTAPTTTTTIGTTTRRVDATTTLPTPTSNPAFEAIKNQINDLSRNVSKFSNVL